MACEDDEPDNDEDEWVEEEPDSAIAINFGFGPSSRNMAGMNRDFNSHFNPRRPTSSNRKNSRVDRPRVELLLAINGPLGGDKQTVPRAELQAIITLLQVTAGTIRVCTDSDYVYIGFNRGHKHVHNENNDLWIELWEAHHARNGTIFLQWVPSHVAEHDIATSNIPPWCFFNNQVADGLCTAIAEDFQVPSEVASQIEDLDRVTGLIRNRLVRVHELWFSLSNADYLHDVNREEVAKPAKKARQEITEAASKHNITKFAPSRWACSDCFTSVNPLQTVSLQYWLASNCIKLHRPPWARFSHHYFRRGDLHVCLRCGAHSEGGARVVRLKRPCGPPFQTQWLKDNQLVAS